MKIERITEKIIQSSYEIEVCLYSRSIKRCQKLIIFWVSFSGKRLNFEASLQCYQRIGNFWTSKLSLFGNILTFFKQKTWDLMKTLGSPWPTTGLGISSGFNSYAKITFWNQVGNAGYFFQIFKCSTTDFSIFSKEISKINSSIRQRAKH